MKQNEMKRNKVNKKTTTIQSKLCYDDYDYDYDYVHYPL